MLFKGCQVNNGLVILLFVFYAGAVYLQVSVSRWQTSGTDDSGSAIWNSSTAHTAFWQTFLGGWFPWTSAGGGGTLLIVEEQWSCLKDGLLLISGQCRLQAIHLPCMVAHYTEGADSMQVKSKHTRAGGSSRCMKPAISLLDNSERFCNRAGQVEALPQQTSAARSERLYFWVVSHYWTPLPGLAGCCIPQSLHFLIDLRRSRFQAYRYSPDIMLSNETNNISAWSSLGLQTLTHYSMGFSRNWNYGGSSSQLAGPRLANLIPV